MTDWARDTKNRNYGIRKRNGTISRDLLRNIIVIVMCATSLSIYLSIRIQIIHTGYEIQRLVQKEAELTRTQEKLVVREGILQSPERIDRIARGRLGMEPLRPEQMLSPLTPYVPIDRSVLAMANSYP